MEDVVVSVTTNIVDNGDGTATTNVVNNTEPMSTLRNATFSIAANGNLKLEKSATVGGLTVAEGGTITLVADAGGMAKLTIGGSSAPAGNIKIVLDFGDKTPPSLATFQLLEANGINIANVSVVDKNNVRNWRPVLNNGVLYATSNGGFFIHLQ